MMGIPGSFGMMVGRLRSALGLLGEEALCYRQMAYGLFLSRGISDRNIEWTVSRENIIHYIEFHLDRPCNPSAFCGAMGCFDYKDGYFYFPKGEGRRKKLNRLKNSGAYRYPNGVATSIANTKLKDLQSFAAIFQKETAKKYYLCLQGLLSAVKDGVTAKGMENYLAFHLGTACDEKLLDTLLRIFSKISDTGGKLYRLESNAFTLYWQRKCFREQKQSGAETCPYPLTQIYRICYPEITGQLQTQFQTLEMTPDAADTFVQGMEKLRHCCSERIGTEYLRQLVREQFFAGDQQVIRLLLSRLDMALQKQKTEAAAASVALRSMTFAAAKGEESYTSFSREDCRAYLLKNREPADESHLAKQTEDICNCNIFDYGDSSFVAMVDFWMPDLQTDSYYADALCHKYLENPK